MLTRHSSSLAWLRVRLQVAGKSAGAVLAHGQLWAELLPQVVVGGAPLHRALALRGALLSAQADGQGAVAHVVTDHGRLAEVIEVLDQAVRAPAGTDVVSAARERTALMWRWASEDSEALADLTADVALHSSSWAGVHDDLVAAMIHEASAGAPPTLDDLRVAYVGPAVESDALTRLSRRERPPQVNATGDDAARLRLNVVSDGSVLIRLCWRVPPRGTRDFAALAIAARVIGGHHHSQLTQEFRVKRRWSYSPWAMLRSARGQGMWQVSVRVPAEHVDEALPTVCGMVNNYQSEEREHAAAVAHTATETRRLWSSGDSAATLLGYWQDLDLDPAAEQDRWLSALATTTPADVTAAVHRWLACPPQLEVILT
jgi:hypothetical protein